MSLCSSSVTRGSVVAHREYGNIYEVIPCEQQKFRLFVTEIQSGPDATDLFCIEYDKSSKAVTILDGKMRPTTREAFNEARRNAA